MMFESEYGLQINGTAFKVKSYAWVDETETVQHSEYALARQGESCAWFFVPLSERKRLESLGVNFVAEQKP